MLGWIIAAVAAIIIFWGLLTFNGLVRRKNLVAEAWAGIETQLKRRADLIPNLIETVKGYAAHERGTMDQLTRLRAQSQASTGAGDLAARGQTEQAITAAIGKIMAVAENYPDLKASANFQQLQSELADIEDQIQLARRYYNASVRDYNVMIQQAPSNIIAGWFAFKPADFFQIEDAADRAVPKVSFS
jgi:LemA protein